MSGPVPGEAASLFALLRLAVRVTAGAGSVEQALDAVVAAVCRHAGRCVGHVLVTDPSDPGRLTASGVWHDADAERYRRFRAVTEATSFAAGEDLPGRVLAAGRPEWADDVRHDARFQRSAAVEAGLRSAAAFPVLVDGEVAAVLEFLGEHAVAPTEAFLATMESVASHLARVAERERAADRADELTTARRRPPEVARAGDHRELSLALDRGELRLAYQPKVSLSTDRIVGVEALLRWEHPMRGPVAPGEFIPLAEASGLIVAFGEWVLWAACRQVAHWQRAFPSATPLQMAINVSPGQFGPRLVDSVRAVLAGTGADPAGVCLEVTEGMVMHDVEAAIAVLRELKALGVSISVDDFGTGYSSLAYLRHLPLDEVKIDKSFVAGLGVDAEHTAIVAAIVSLAHALERDVVAEGVETADQIERLRSLGCEFAQGFALGRPLPPREIGALLAGDAAGHAPASPDVEDRPRAGRAVETVLVADDAADIRQLARMSLTAAGFAVAEAADGLEAIRMAPRLQPACVILDLNMPELSGIDVCAQLRSHPATSGCTIIMLTAQDAAGDKVAAFRSGADDYIVKPFAPRDLVARVRSAVRRRELADAG